MNAEPPDAVDGHVARWATFWEGNPAFQPEVEGVTTRLVWLLQQRRREFVAVFAQSKDFTLEDFETMHRLMIEPFPGESTPARLADALNVTRAAITSRLDRLADAKMVTRRVDGADRRRVLVSPTAAGRAAWNEYAFRLAALEQEMFSALSEDELKQLNGLLRKVVRSREA